MDDDTLLSVKQVCVRIGKSYKTGLKLIKSGKIPSITKKNEKNLETYWVKPSVVEQYLNSGSIGKFTEEQPQIKQKKQIHIRGNRSELELLRERVNGLEMDKTFLINQIKIKDEQIKSITGIVEKLQITNQYLLIEGNKDKPRDNEEPIDISLEHPEPLNPKKQEIMDLINKKVSKSWGDKKISQWLNKKGIETITGKGQWYPKTVYRLRTGKG
jgi:hypothetical protein